jgi:hypothetical protein
MRCAVLVLLVACSGGAPAVEHARPAGERAPGQVSGETVGQALGQPLGMNDISILLPLPREVRVPVLAAVAGDGTELVDRRWYDALVAACGDIAPRNGAAIRFAVRFDLCDRSAIGVCPLRSGGPAPAGAAAAVHASGRDTRA